MLNKCIMAGNNNAGLETRPGIAYGYNWLILNGRAVHSNRISRSL